VYCQRYDILDCNALQIMKINNPKWALDLLLGVEKNPRHSHLFNRCITVGFFMGGEGGY
jgi:hypothetical protein